MQRLVIPAIAFLLVSLTSSAQDMTEPRTIGDPVTVTENKVTVKTKGSKYRYMDISIKAIPGREDELSTEALEKYEPFAAMLRDSLLFVNGRSAAQQDMLRWLADAVKEGTNLQTDASGPFDIAGVAWREKTMAVDFFAGPSVSSPLGFLSSYTDPAAGGTVDLGLYAKNAFIRAAYCVGSGRVAEDKGLKGELNGGKNASRIELSLNFGYMIPVGSNMAVSPFVGVGKSSWNYRAHRFPVAYEGVTLAEGVEVTLFLHRSFHFSISEPYVSMPAVRLRLYSDQILNSFAKGPIPTLNASLCFGFYHRLIGR